jgi:hypothetical protein
MLVGVVLLFLTRAWARVGRGRYVLMTFALTLMGFGVVLVARTRLALVPVAILVTALGAPFVVARLQDLGLSARQYFAFLLVPFYGFPYLSFRLVFSPGRSGAAEAPTSAPVPPEGGASGADSAAGYPVTAVALAATLLAATGGYWWLRAGAAARDAGPALPETRPAPSVVAVASPPRPASPAAPAAPPDSTAGAGPPAVPATIPPGAKLSATVRSEAPAVDGTLDPQIVASVVKSRLGGLRACHQRALDRSRRVLSGRMVVHWTITGTGAVSGIDLETDTVGDAEMAGCVKALVAGWRFPRPADGSVEVAFPFVFQPSQ